MTARNINVIFYIPDYDCFDTHIHVTHITDAQLEQLQKSVSTAKLPADSCLTSISTKFIESMSFMNGGARRDRIAEHNRTLEISNLFYLKNKNHQTPCGKCTNKDERSLMRHCAKNLRAGKCQDEFMRSTLGATLFPKLYITENQK